MNRLANKTAVVTGGSLARSASASTAVETWLSIIGVSMAPGLMTLTRPRSLSSTVHVRASERTAAFAAL